MAVGGAADQSDWIEADGRRSGPPALVVGAASGRPDREAPRAGIVYQSESVEKSPCVFEAGRGRSRSGRGRSNRIGPSESEPDQVLDLDVAHATTTGDTLVDVVGARGAFHVEVSTVGTHDDVGIEHTRDSPAAGHKNVLGAMSSRVEASRVESEPPIDRLEPHECVATRDRVLGTVTPTPGRREPPGTRSSTRGVGGVASRPVGPAGPPRVTPGAVVPTGPNVPSPSRSDSRRHPQCSGSGWDRPVRRGLARRRRPPRSHSTRHRPVGQWAMVGSPGGASLDTDRTAANDRSWAAGSAARSFPTNRSRSPTRLTTGHGSTAPLGRTTTSGTPGARSGGHLVVSVGPPT